MLTVDFERLALPPGSRVLDVGCGDGRHARGTRRLRGVGAVALDLRADKAVASADSLRTMDATDAALGGTVPEAGPWVALRGDTFHLPFRDGAFDCVIASEVLEHLPDDDTALAEITRVLRPSGQLAVSVPRFGPEAVCWALSSDYHHAEGGHVRIYRRRALRRKLAAHGYRILGSHHAHALHSPYWWLRCLTGLEGEGPRLVRWYHRLLVWDVLRRPRVTRVVERALDPLIGKSLVLYARKNGGG